MAKKVIIKGVGSMMAKRIPTDPLGPVEIITLGTLQDLKIDLNVEMEDIYGGDGLFPIDTLLKSKSIEVNATDVKFDLAAIELLMGSKVKEGQSDVPLWVLNEHARATLEEVGGVEVAVVSVRHAGSLATDPQFAVRLKDSNILLKTVAFKTGVTPDNDEVMLHAATGRLLLHKDHANKDIAFNYQRLADNVDIVDILKDEVPVTVHLVHHGSFLQKDGTYAGIETELFACRPRGNFTIDAQRAAASSSTITLQVIDPERSDCKLGSIKRYNTNEKPACC